MKILFQVDIDWCTENHYLTRFNILTHNWNIKLYLLLLWKSQNFIVVYFDHQMGAMHCFCCLKYDICFFFFASFWYNRNKKMREKRTKQKFFIPKIWVSIAYVRSTIGLNAICQIHSAMIDNHEGGYIMASGRFES